jgi:hypothetical protein
MGLRMFNREGSVLGSHGQSAVCSIEGIVGERAFRGLLHREGLVLGFARAVRTGTAWFLIAKARRREGREEEVFRKWTSSDPRGRDLGLADSTGWERKFKQPDPAAVEDLPHGQLCKREHG